MYRLTSERGAVLMHVILAVFMLIGINVFVVDYGVMWVGRNQAQNSADAGAFAGAIALAYDNFTDRTDTGPAKVHAWQTSQQNWVWGQAPKVNITTDVTFPVIPNDPCADTTCVRVDVYRDNSGANPLPSLFGGAVGVTGSGVKAMAIARWGAANASDCLKPFAIPDKWFDHYDDPANSGPPKGTVDVDKWTADDYFDFVYPKSSKVGKPGDPIPAADRDVYIPSSKATAGTGFTLTNDLGTQVTLYYGKATDSPSPGNFLPVDLPLPGGGVSSGGADYSKNIANCNGAAVAVGDTLQTEPGLMKGPTSSGIDALIAKDPLATWDSTKKAVTNSCAQAATPCAKVSPRVVAIPVFSPSQYETDRLNGKSQLQIVNILGFFIQSQNASGDITGYFTSIPGLILSGKPSINQDSGFSKVIMLVR
jgi:hypothetical protein